MQLLPRRTRRARHSIAAGPSAATVRVKMTGPPEAVQAVDNAIRAAGHQEAVAYDTSYDHNGWGENSPAPAADENTMLFRVPGLDGGPGFVIPPGLPSAWSRDEDTLRRAAAALRDQPATPGPAEPGAFLRAIMPGGPQPFDALAGSPCFAGVIRRADGGLQAGLYLGDEDTDGRMVIDVTDPAWLADLIEAAQEALAAFGLEAGRRSAA